MNEQEKNVVEYLTEHPNFFTTHPHLLAKLSVIHPQKGTLSLIEAQLEQQRQQIKTLTAFLEKFHQLAYQEADIFYALMPLQKKLFQAEDFQRGECCRPRILGNITAKNGNLEKSVISHFKRILTANFEKIKRPLN